jgi:hypothetical protein
VALATAPSTHTVEGFREVLNQFDGRRKSAGQCSALFAFTTSFNCLFNKTACWRLLFKLENEKTRKKDK